MSLYKSFSGLPLRIWLLAGVNLLNRCGAMVMCFLTLYLTEYLHFPLTYAGYAMTCYSLGAVAGTFLGGKLTDLWGYQRVQLSSLISTGIMLCWVMQVRDFWAMCASLFMLNFVSEAFRPANATAIRQNSTPETFTRSASLMRTAFNIAIAIALTVGGWIILIGWQHIFWIDALTCWIAAFVLWRFVPDLHKPDNLVQEMAKKQHTPEQQANPIGIINELSADNNSISTLSPYRDRLFLTFAFCTFLGAFAFMQIVWTLSPFFKQVYGWNEFTIGLVCAINGIVVMLVEMPLIFRIEKQRGTLWFIRWGIVLYAVSYALLTLPVEYKWLIAVLYMIIISFGEILVMPFSSTWVSQNTAIEKQGAYWALYGIAYSAANVLAPLVGTQIIDNFGYTALWYFVVTICGIAWVGFSTLPQHSHSLIAARLQAK
jgi:predicted MFS family arabinose efflux permease